MNADTNNSKMLSPCDELQELLPSYVLGATSAQETIRVQQLLTECPESSADLRDYVQVTQGLLKTNPALQPPAHLHDKLMKAIAVPQPIVTSQSIESTALKPLTPLVALPKTQRNWAWGAVAAVLVLFIATNLFWLTRFNEIPSNNVQATVIALVNNPLAQPIRLLGEGNILQATAFLNESTGEVWLYSDQLAQLPEDQTYQLWLIGSNIQSVGIFRTDDAGISRLMLEQALTTFDSLGISIEPRTGSEQPTSNPIAVGNLS